MTGLSGQQVAGGASVVLDDDRVWIHELVVEGAAVAAARDAVARSRDLEQTVRQMLEIGGAVLLHGSSKATVDAVGAEVDRLLALLSERSDRIEAVRRVQARVAAKGFAFEELLAPAVDS